MVTLAQRIEALRTERGLSRPALSAALGFPRVAVEKFETGRQTPSKEQQEKMAAFFDVSLFYLRGESNDRTRQDNWMDFGTPEEEEPVYTAPRRAPRPAPAPAPTPSGDQGTLFDSLAGSRSFQDTLQNAVLEALRSPEGQKLLTQAIRKELARQR